MSIPALVWAGEADDFYQNARDGAAHMPDATFVSLPGLMHSQANARSDLVLLHIHAFLARVDKVSR